LLHELNHGFTAAGGVHLVLSFEFCGDLEVQGFRLQRRHLLQVLGCFLQRRWRFALLFWCRRHLRCYRHAAFSRYSFVAKLIMPCAISAARSFRLEKRVSVTALPSSAALRNPIFSGIEPGSTL